MIDFNGSEIVVLAVLAVIIFGPEKLPDLARKTARVFHYLRGIANDARGQLRAELGPEYADISLSDLNPRNIGQRLLGEETTQILRDASAGMPKASELVSVSSPEVAIAPAAARNDSVGQPRLIAFDPEAT